MAKKRKYQRKTLRIAQIRVIKDGPHWVRDHGDERLDKLKDSIAERGQMHDIIVRPTKRSKATFELLAGGRRFHAIKELGLETVDVKVAVVDDVEAELISLEENLTILKPTSGDWSQRVERRRQLINIQRGVDPHAKPKGGRPSKKASKSKGKEKNHRQVAVVSEPVSAAELADDLGVSQRTVERAQRRERNLTPESKAAWRLGKLTDAQVDELAATAKSKQAAVLKDMLTQRSHAQQSGADDRNEELSAAKSRVELKKRLRACENLCRKELVPELHDIVGAMKEDELLVDRLSSVPTAKLTDARDLIDELLDSLGR